LVEQKNTTLEMINHSTKVEKSKVKNFSLAAIKVVKTLLSLAPA
jgi:hypothetical protein